ncbi:MAG: sensor histidine kinase [Spirochaetales bacterium]|nr:sensor histidine kinase [Spirochaetales bacterium]
MPEIAIQKGTLDLRSTDPTTLGALPLRGDWAFFWRQLQPAANEEPLAYGPIDVSWTVAFSEKYSQVESRGYATYRLRILLPATASHHVWGVRSMTQTGALTIRLNGEPVLNDGLPGTSLETTDLKSGKGQVLFRLPDATTGELLLEFTIASPDHPRGGAGGPVHFGSAQAIERLNREGQAMDLFLATGLLLFGIYHLGMFAIRREEKAALYFGMFLLVIALRTLLSGEYLSRELWPSLSFQVEMHLGYFTYFFAGVTALLYFHFLFPARFLTRFVYVLCSIAVFFSILSLSPFVSRGDLAEIVRYYHSITFLILITGLILCGLALKKKEPGSLIFLLGFILLVGAALYDILSNLNIVSSSSALFPLGLMGFSISQSFLIYKRFSRTFSEVALLSARLRKTNAELEEMARVKDEFLAHLSHELRTPLTLIQGSAELLEMSEPDELQKNSVKRITEGSATLSSYVDDLMLVTDVQSTPDLQWTAVDLAACCREALNAVEGMAAMQNITTHLDSPEGLTIEADSRLTQRMILNIAKNAVLYNVPGGRLSISLEDNADKVKIWIRDSGPGIPVSEREAIFEKFHRLGEDKPGVGLGLFLARKIAQLHGGQISLVDSDSGATFCIELPVRQLSR